jgi:hypothetical protein
MLARKALYHLSILPVLVLTCLDAGDRYLSKKAKDAI